MNQESPAAEPRLQWPLLGYHGRRHQVRLTGRCDACGLPAPLAAYEAREWLRLGPLPLYPLRRYRVFDECPLCRHRRRLPVEEYERWVDEQLAPDLAALQAAPDDPARRLAVVWKCYGLGRMYQALALLAPVLAAGEAPAAAHHAAGVVLRALGRLNEALAELAQAAEQEPDEPAFRLDYGRALLCRRDRLALAEHHLEAAVHRAPKDFDAWLSLAHARARRGHWSGAWQAWQRCRQLDPEGRKVALHEAWAQAVRRRLPEEELAREVE